MQKLLTLCAVAALTLGTLGCTPPAEEDVNISTDTSVPAAEETSNSTYGSETPDSNSTMGSETPSGETP